jgi:hypothetical protein
MGRSWIARRDFRTGGASTSSAANPAPQQPAPTPVEQHTTNNFNVTVEGELPFDPSACVTTTTLVHRFPVYERPDANSPLVEALEVGDSVCVLSTGEWTPVHFKRGKAFEGWVHGLEIQGQRGHIDSATARIPRGRPEQPALPFWGAPTLTGGTPISRGAAAGPVAPTNAPAGARMPCVLG